MKEVELKMNIFLQKCCWITTCKISRANSFPKWLSKNNQKRKHKHKIIKTIINTSIKNDPTPTADNQILHNCDLMSVLTNVRQNTILFSTLASNKHSFLCHFNFYFHCEHVTIFNFHFVISKQRNCLHLILHFSRLQLYRCLIANPPNGP